MLKNTFTKMLKDERYVVPGTILLLVLLAYGLLAPWLGFYWDDWPYAWLLHFFGPSEFFAAQRPFRPLLGPIYAATTTLLGGNPLIWQLAGLAARVFLSLELWYVLRLVWPSQRWNLIWVVLLFTVYPGYQQQWVAFTHINQEFIPLIWLIASFGITAWAIRYTRHQRSLTILALILQALGLFATEYFFGLEILRFFFIVAILAETMTTWKDVLKKAGLYWLPYLGVWTLNALWTYAYHLSAAYKSYGIHILSGSSLSPLAIGNEILNTLSLSGFMSWLSAFNIFSPIDGTLTQALSLLIFLFSAFIVFILMQFIHNDDRKMDQGQVKSDTWSLWAMAMGLIAIFAGRLPSWAAGLPLKLEFDYDRFMVSIMLGASMFIVGLGTYILKNGKRKLVILSLLIGLSTAYQFNAANTFRRDWDNQRAFFWQLIWRMPSLKKGTALLTYELPLKYVSDMQITAPINWIYAPTMTDRELPYLLIYIKSRFNSSVLPSLQPNTPIQAQYRTAHFDGSTSNSVTIYKDADGCLRALDSVYGNSETVPGASYFLLNAIPLSNLDQIQAGAPQPTPDRTLFGSEPAHDWCYFYEKAELARQQFDWEQVVKLYDQARKNGFSASVPAENLPFIEGFATLGKTDAALELTARTLKAQKELCPAVLTLWDRVSQTSSTLDMSEVNAHIRQDGCKRQ